MFAPHPATTPSQAVMEQPPRPVQTSPTTGLHRASRVHPDGRSSILQRSSNRHHAMSSRRNDKHPSTSLSSAATTAPEAPPPSHPPPLPPVERGRAAPRTTQLLRRPRPDRQALSPRDGVILTSPPFEEPRRAPQPPQRPPRPPDEVCPPPTPSSSGVPQSGGISTTRETGPSRMESSRQMQTPPSPEGSPVRHVAGMQSQESEFGSTQPLFAEGKRPRVAAPQCELPAVPLRGPAIASGRKRSQNPSQIASAAPSTSPFMVASPFEWDSCHRSYSPLEWSDAPVPPTRFQPARQSPDVVFRMALHDMRNKARQGSAWSDSSDDSAPVRPHARVRSNTAPPSLARTGGTSSQHAARATLLSGSGHPAKSMRAGRSSSASPRSLGSPRLKGWEKNRWSYRPDRAGEVRAAPFPLAQTGKGKKDVRKDAVTKHERSPISTQAQSGGKKKRNGETMSMLVHEGFFPVAELVLGNAKRRSTRLQSDIGFRLNSPPRLSFIDKCLPPTPTSVQSTPIEVYQTERGFPRAPGEKSRNRRSGGVQRSPLSLITQSDTNARREARNRRKPDQASPGGLAAIPEDAAGAENSPPASGATTPVATQIHLRGGSIVTVTPPELTAWKPTVYIHGPIKLPKPAIMPRKNSVASLEPFQEAVDNVYQNALSRPRRRSDDAVVDDICDFFDEYGFEFVSFGGDRLSSLMDLDMDNGEAAAEIERFSTPPAEQPGVSPVEVVIAKEVLETSAHSRLATPRAAAPVFVAPPVETEEMLRARGIARLSRMSAGSSSSESEQRMKRKESLTAGLPLLPAPEESILDAVLQASSRPGTRDSASSTDGVHRQRTKGRDRDSGYGPSGSSERVGREGSVAYAARTHSSRRGGGGGYSGGSVRRHVHDRHGTGGGSAGGDQGGFDWDDDDVDEIEAGTSWVAPVAAPERPVNVIRGLSTRKSRNPVAQARRLFATASTMI